MLQNIITTLTIFAAFVTAGATIALWRVTRVLADETRRMAEAAAQPQVVATIESNDWSYIHADLKVSNTGNATAFDISIVFDPPIPTNSDRSAESEAGQPLGQLSVLKPGQTLSSWTGRMYDLLDLAFTVTIRWRNKPGGPFFVYSYLLDMHAYKGLARLGSGDPLVQISNSIKSLKDDFHRVVRSNRLEVDVFDSTDRDQEDDLWKQRITDL